MSKKTEVITTIFDEIGDLHSPDIWGNVYLPIQWQNLLGKWEAPLEFWGGSALEFTHEISQVRHQAKVVPGFLLDSISIAPFAYKVHWGYKDGDNYITANDPDWAVSSNWKSRVHILSLMKEAESTEPIIITAGSNTGKHLLANVRQGQRRLANMLKRIGRANLPTHLFWMEMVAGPPVSVGEGETSQTICPPVAVAPANLHKMTNDELIRFLTGLYVGHDIKDLFVDGLWEEGQEWVIKQPERLQLSDGEEGGVITALPAPKIKAEILEDGSFWFPDLGDATPKTMKDCAYTIPDLWQSREDVDRAFAKVMRQGRIGNAPSVVQWQAWKDYLEKSWLEMMDWQETQARQTAK